MAGFLRYCPNLSKEVVGRLLGEHEEHWIKVYIILFIIYKKDDETEK